MKERREKGLYWDKAWKLVEGCTKVSPGCDHCWSEQETVMRCGHPNTKISMRAADVVCDGFDRASGFDGRIALRPDNLDLPLRTKKPTVFAVWNDLYHADVTDEFRDRAYAVMARCPQHTFLILTKRAKGMSAYWNDNQCWRHKFIGKHLPRGVPNHYPPLNAWHGVTAENQEQADARIPYLLQVPGKRFLSIEPMLGPVDIAGFVNEVVDYGNSSRGLVPTEEINQVLLGGESGKDARPMHPEWVRGVRDQCEAAGVPFYFKQWGEWAPTDLSPAEVAAQGKHAVTFWTDVQTHSLKVGKKKAGRLLDGVLYDELVWDHPRCHHYKTEACPCEVISEKEISDKQCLEIKANLVKQTFS